MLGQRVDMDVSRNDKARTLYLLATLSPEQIDSFIKYFIEKASTTTILLIDWSEIRSAVTHSSSVES
jgi:hypothetical protein